MLKFDNIRIVRSIAHKVGNKNKSQGNFISQRLLELDEPLEQTLVKFFIAPFKKATETYQFTHSVDMSYHLLNGLAEKALNSVEEFIPASVDILQHLYEQSNHPQIKTGDVFVVLFDDILLGDELVRGLGIFKCERKDAFLTLTEATEQVVVDENEGISLKKLDKGCLILDTLQGDGYRILSVDNNNYDTSYWKAQFLGVDYVKDTNYDTRSYLDMCQSFAEEVIREKTGKKDQIEFLSDTIQYFTLNDEVVDGNFQDTLFKDDAMKISFDNYKQEYQEQHEVELPPSIPISKPVLKQQKKSMKSNIKLDTGIQVKLDMKDPDSSRDFVEKGYDSDKEMFFYKVYFNEEMD